MRRIATGLCTWCLVMACGDNASQCGEGTVEVDGVCLPGEPPAPPCAAGTLLDVPTGTCVIDPAACTDGTILVGSECRDPGDDVVVDVLEAAEPNGFGVGGEASTSPAGLVTLRAPGAPPVILKGTLAPHPGADYDTYVLDVTGPTLLDVTVDGARGISGGLVALAEDPALAGWRRESVSLVGDAAHRQLYLPVAGRYHLAIADTRTLLVGAAVGDADASYLVALTALTPPTATTLTTTGGVITTTGTVDERTPQLFALPLGAGTTELALTTASPALTGGLVLVIDGAVVGVAHETRPGTGAARLGAEAVAPGALVLAIVEAAASTTTALVAFDLAVEVGAAPPAAPAP